MAPTLLVEGATPAQLRRTDHLLRKMVLQDVQHKIKNKHPTTGAVAAARRILVREKSQLVGFRADEGIVERYTPEQLSSLLADPTYRKFKEVLQRSVSRRTLATEDRRRKKAPTQGQADAGRVRWVQAGARWVQAGQEIQQEREERLLLAQQEREDAREAVDLEALADAAAQDEVRTARDLERLTVVEEDEDEGQGDPEEEAALHGQPDDPELADDPEPDESPTDDGEAGGSGRKVFSAALHRLRLVMGEMGRSEHLANDTCKITVQFKPGKANALVLTFSVVQEGVDPPGKRDAKRSFKFTLPASSISSLQRRLPSAPIEGTAGDGDSGGGGDGGGGGGGGGDDDAGEPLIGSAALDVVLAIKSIQKPIGGGGQTHNLWTGAGMGDASLLAVRGATRVELRFADAAQGTALLETLCGAPPDGSPHLDQLAQDLPPLGADADFADAPKEHDQAQHDQILVNTNQAKVPTLLNQDAILHGLSELIGKYERRTLDMATLDWKTITEPGWEETFRGSLANPKSCAQCVVAKPQAGGGTVDCPRQVACNVEGYQGKWVLVDPAEIGKGEVVDGQQRRFVDDVRNNARFDRTGRVHFCCGERVRFRVEEKLASVRARDAQARARATAAAARAAVAANVEAQQASAAAQRAEEGAATGRAPAPEPQGEAAVGALPRQDAVTKYVCPECGKKLLSFSLDGAKKYMNWHKPDPPGKSLASGGCVGGVSKADKHVPENECAVLDTIVKRRAKRSTTT